MDKIHIDHLSLSITGPGERGERLARMIADGIADISIPPPTPVDVSKLTLRLNGMTREIDNTLADRIVAEIVNQLNQIT